ncbi:MAG: hypothetical protein NC253_06710 [Ruminococcus sp.]|nr:hypothetical protein [Ruminococcus sp.]MCM1380979.1 hypothetical protein [Muribaculaceae bacterium]MCM1480886.1 hypothetical protein [Muribaculaceae bacterium]
MQKMIRVNEKRLAVKYNRRLFLASIPAVSVIVSLLAVVLIFVLWLREEMPLEMYRTIFYAAYAACAYGFAVCLIGSVIEDILIKAHREHTYIHIAGTVMVVSQHVRTVFNEGRWVHYKKMWVVKLADVENVECVRNRLTITAKARFFNENSEWLGYRREGDGIAFDRWWYDQNGGKDVSSIEITDFYTYGERIARHITNIAQKTRERDARRKAYHAEMMEIAKNASHPKKLTDRYVSAEKRAWQSPKKNKRM